MKKAAVVLDLKGFEVADDELDLLTHPLTGGVILFTRNYQNPEQLQNLCRQIKKVNPDLVISVDHEGGRVQRFREGFTRLPSMVQIGNLYKSHQRYAMQMAEWAGFVMASELRCAGVDLSYAPVLDLDKSLNDVIGDRAFSDRPDVVAELAVCFLNGMHHAGMKGVGKHFPGHGHVTEDSHLALPHDGRELEQILYEDVYPFRLLISSGLSGVMPAHVIYDQVDADHPAGFSSIWLQQILKQQLAFKGVIFSDDLSMEGAAKAQADVTERGLAAINAGCNCLLICNNPTAARELLSGLDKNNVLFDEVIKSLIPEFAADEIKQQELNDAQKAVKEFVESN